jgi:hypothetical protein
MYLQEYLFPEIGTLWTRLFGSDAFPIPQQKIPSFFEVGVKEKKPFIYFPSILFAMKTHLDSFRLAPEVSLHVREKFSFFQKTLVGLGSFFVKSLEKDPSTLFDTLLFLDKGDIPWKKEYASRPSRYATLSRILVESYDIPNQSWEKIRNELRLMMVKESEDLPSNPLLRDESSEMETESTDSSMK